jgi:hypothetical protein
VSGKCGGKTNTYGNFGRSATHWDKISLARKEQPTEKDERWTKKRRFSGIFGRSATRKYLEKMSLARKKEPLMDQDER